MSITWDGEVDGGAFAVSAANFIQRAGVWEGTGLVRADKENVWVVVKHVVRAYTMIGGVSEDRAVDASVTVKTRVRAKVQPFNYSQICTAHFLSSE